MYLKIHVEPLSDSFVKTKEPINNVVMNSSKLKIDRMTFEEGVSMRVENLNQSHRSSSIGSQAELPRFDSIKLDLNDLGNNSTSEEEIFLEKYNRDLIGKFLSKSFSNDYISFQKSFDFSDESKIDFNYGTDKAGNKVDDFDPLLFMDAKTIKKHVRRKSCTCSYCGVIKKDHKGMHIVLDTEDESQKDNKKSKNLIKSH